MKTLLIISIAIFLNSAVIAQKVKPVPSVVRKSFSQKFPNIKRVIWDNSNGKVWETEFRINGNEYSATFDLKGKWIETEHEISRNEIPSQVKSALSKEFEGYKIIESKISESPKAKVYEIGLKKDNEKVKVILDTEGKILKRTIGKGMDYIEDENDPEE